MLMAAPAMMQAQAINAILAFMKRTASRVRGIARERAKSICPLFHARRRARGREIRHLREGVNAGKPVISRSV